MSVLGDRLQRYREFAPAMTEKERAEEEAQLWALVPAAERPKEGRGAWLAANCGGSSFTYENRCTLYMAGAVADPLWARVDADMTLNTAVTLLREAAGRWHAAIVELGTPGATRAAGTGDAKEGAVRALADSLRAVVEERKRSVAELAKLLED